MNHPFRTRPRRAIGVVALPVLLALMAFLTTAVAQDALSLHDFSDGAPVGKDAAGNDVGFVPWQDGSSTLELSVVEIEPDGELALPDQEATTSALRVVHGIDSWGGFSHVYFGEDVATWASLDLSGYDGIRFMYKGDGQGGTVQFDFFDNRDPNVTSDTAERFAFRFVDDTTDWRMVEVPFDELVRRSDWQPNGAPDDGLTLSMASGWALGFPAGEGTSYLASVEAFEGESSATSAASEAAATTDDSASSEEASTGPSDVASTLPIYDFADGAPVGEDPAGNQVGFPIWQDGSSTLDVTTVEVEPGSDLALPDQDGTVSVLSVLHEISGWGGFTHAYTDADATSWEPLDVSAYDGIRFWYKGDGRGGTVQFDFFDNRNPELPGDSAERYAYRFVDDTTDWRMVEVPFDELFRRTDFQPGGAPDDGLTLSESWGWALGFPPGEGTSYVYGIEAYALAGSTGGGGGEPISMPIYDFADGAPVGEDPAGNQVGFPIWQDGSSTLDVTTEEVAPDGELALPDQDETVSVLSVLHEISGWGGFTHAYTDESASSWQPLDLAQYDGIRFWYKGDGRGGTVQFDFFDNRNPELPGDSAERYAYRFVDDTTDWRQVEVPFDELFRRTDFQPGGAPDDGLTLSESWGWALGFPPGEGTSYVYGIEAYGTAGGAAADELTVQFASPAYRLPENGEVEVVIELSAASEEAVSVRVFVQGDSATPMRDLVARSELLVFPPGVTEASFTVRAIDDGKFEGEERGALTLGNQRGADLGFLRRAILVIDDDDEPVAGQIEDFEYGVGPVSSETASLSTAELLATTPIARPNQERFENVLVADGGDASFSLNVDLAYRQDWSDGDALSFWYYGRGDGSDVTITILDDAAAGNTAEAGFETFFADEFDAEAGTSPDWSVWTPEIGDGTANGIPGWGNNELQAYTDTTENVAHDGEGNLVITARRSNGDAPECYYGGPCEYTSARLITLDTIEFTYGRVEASLKIPYGNGLWPAFWLLGANIADVPWPTSGEIDIMENIGREPTTVHGTIHGPGYSGGNGVGNPYQLPDQARFADDFHEYALEWEPGELRWYVDDVLFSTVTPDDIPNGTEWVYDHPFFIILNVAVGGNWPGLPDETTEFPQTMAIDYVRVLQPADVAERFEVTFSDDVAGWRQVDVLFDAFVRSDEQPEGAPNDGLGLERVSGFTMDFAAGEPIRIDDLRVVGD